MTLEEPSAPAQQPDSTPDVFSQTAEQRTVQAWRERERLFFARHHEVLRLQGTLGFSVSLREPGPVTVMLDNTADLPRVRQSVRDLFSDMGLTLTDLRFERKDPPPAIAYVLPKRAEPDTAPPAAEEKDGSSDAPR